MHRKNVIIIPAMIFFLYLYPLDFSTNPKTTDASGMGVNKKNNHIFSTGKLLALDTAPTNANAPHIDSSDATNNTIEITLHLFGMILYTTLDGFLYICE